MKWISVQDRLPPIEEDVLCVSYRIFVGYYEGKNDWVSYACGCCFDVPGKPTHWMPLPEKP